MENRNGYIKISSERLEPCISINIGDEVVVKNGNGNYYKGTIKSKEKWCKMMLSPGKRLGIIVEFPDCSLILNLKDLLKIKDKNPNKNQILIDFK